MAVFLAIYQSIRSLLERREYLVKNIILERQILNNRKVVDVKPNQTSTTVSVVHNRGRKFSGMVGGYLCVDQTTGEERVSASRTGAKC